MKMQKTNLAKMYSHGIIFYIITSLIILNLNSCRFIAMDKTDNKLLINNRAIIR